MSSPKSDSAEAEKVVVPPGVVTVHNALELAAYCAIQARKQMDGTHDGMTLNSMCAMIGVVSNAEHAGVVTVTITVDLSKDTAHVEASHTP